MKNLGGSNEGNVKTKVLGFYPVGTMVFRVMSKRCIVLMCAWCKGFIGFKDGGGVVGYSHGLCSGCSEEINKKGGCDVS